MSSVISPSFCPVLLTIQLSLSTPPSFTGHRKAPTVVMLESLLVTVKVIWVLSAVKVPLGVMVNSGVVWAAATVTG